MQYPLQVMDHNQGRRATLNKKLQLLSHIENGQVQDKQQRFQAMESADAAPYCCMWLSQSCKASKCPIVPAQPLWKVLNGRATNLKRKPMRQRRNCQPHMPGRGPRSPMQPDASTTQSSNTVRETPPTRSTRLVNGRQHQPPQES